ncbi:MAG: two-component regulator propeller domain-containing protein [Ignavibacteriota bacterium]
MSTQMRLLITWSPLCLLLLSCTRLSALDPKQPIGQLYHSSWGPKEGVTGTVESLAQTADGFLWLGTSNGLLRFDGVSFERYQPETGTLPSNHPTTLFAMADGGLWIGYFNGGASFLKNGRVTNYDEHEGFPTGYVRKFARTPDGVIWVAAVGGLARFDGARWQHINQTWNFPVKSPSTVAVDGNGTVWTCGWREGVFFLLKGERQFRQVGSSPIPGPQPAFVEGSDGAMWLWVPRTSSILRFAERGSQGEPRRRSFIKTGEPMLIDRDGSLWVATADNGLRRIPFPAMLRGSHISDSDPAVEKFSRQDGLTDVDVYEILEDREGNIWVTTASGIDRFRFRNLSWRSVQSSPYHLTMAVNSQGTVWAGSERVLVDATNGAAIPGGPRWISFAYGDREGAIWLWGGTDEAGGFWRWQGGRFVRIHLPYTTPVRAMAQESSGRFWISIRGSGVFQVDHPQGNGGDWKLVELLKGQPDLTAYSEFADSQGRVWFAYPERKAIALWDNGRIQVFSAESGLTVGAVNVVTGCDGQVWAGGEMGLAYFENGRFHAITAADGADFGNITGLIATADQGVWFSSPTGIFHIFRDEVRRSLQDPNHKVRYEVFDLASDLPEPPEDAARFTAAVEGTDGILWFATHSGIARIDPAHLFRNPLPPPVSIRSVFAGGKPHPIYANPSMPAFTRSLKIEYSALSLSIPERVRFRYRLEGVDRDWQDAGAERAASYNNLGPGKYTFQVIACNNDGVWNETGASWKFTIQPAFYQTAWFQTFYLLAGGALIWCFYRLRLRQMTARVNLRYNERLAERTRIARELHDTLLQSLAGISLQLDGISKQVAFAPDKTVSLIRHVREQMDLCFREARVKVWNLRSPALEGQGLASALAEFVERIGPSGCAQCEFTVSGTPRRCPPEIEEDLLRIAQEAVNNAMRHACASEIHVVLEYEERSLALRVSDNGKGFDLETGRRKSGHWGLKGIEERATQLRGKHKITTAAGQGTRVEVRVPLPS